MTAAAFASRPAAWRARIGRRRLGFGMLAALALALIAVLAVAGLRGTLILYRTPTQAVHQALYDRPLRIGGEVEPGSVYVVGDVTRFSLTDGTTTIPVVYRGALPGTFVPGQDALVGGRLTGGRVFDANSLMVKHSAVYRAPNGRPYHPPKIAVGTG